MGIDFQIVPIAIASAAIVADIISGVVKGCATGTLSSSIMREGLWHKVASLLLLFVSWMVNISVGIWDVLPQQMGLVYEACCIYVCGMELISILENVCAANPELSIKKLFAIFNVEREDDRDDC